MLLFRSAECGFKDVAARGKTSVDWFFGLKLHLVINRPLAKVRDRSTEPIFVSVFNQSFIISK